MVAHERLTEPRVTIERVLAKPRSFSNLPTFLDLDGIKIFILKYEAEFLQSYTFYLILF